VKAPSGAGRFAERVVEGRDDGGGAERVVIWIERRPGAVWAVGRAVNGHLRSSDETRPEDVIFEGFELGDALQAANDCLEDDLVVSEEEGVNEHVLPFTEDELLKPLERWFFGHR
jgi:hypothetical protein